MKIGKFQIGKNGKLEQNEDAKPVEVPQEQPVEEVKETKTEEPVKENTEENVDETYYRINIITEDKDFAYDVKGHDALQQEINYLKSLLIDANTSIVDIPQRVIVKSKIVALEYGVVPSSDYEAGEDAED